MKRSWEDGFHRSVACGASSRLGLYLHRGYLLSIAILALVGCGSRTELDDFLVAKPVPDAGAQEVDTDAAGMPDASCSRCVDAGDRPADAALLDAGISDTGTDVASSEAGQFPVCHPGTNALLIVDNVDTYFNTDLHEFDWAGSYATSSYIAVNIDDLPSDDQWTISLVASVDGGALSLGSYDNAVFPFQAGRPSLVVAGDGVGCDETAGSFRIAALDLDDAGAIQQFVATFSQECVGPAGGPLTLNGCVSLSR